MCSEKFRNAEIFSSVQNTAETVIKEQSPLCMLDDSFECEEGRSLFSLRFKRYVRKSAIKLGQQSHTCARAIIRLTVRAFVRMRRR